MFGGAGGAKLMVLKSSCISFMPLISSMPHISSISSMPCISSISYMSFISPISKSITTSCRGSATTAVWKVVEGWNMIGSCRCRAAGGDSDGLDASTGSTGLMIG